MKLKNLRMFIERYDDDCEILIQDIEGTTFKAESIVVRLNEYSKKTFKNVGIVIRANP